MLRERETVIRRAVMIADGLAVLGAFVSAYFLREFFRQVYQLDLFPSTQVIPSSAAALSDYLLLAVIAVPVWCCILAVNGMYRSMRTKTPLEMLWVITKSVAFAALLFGAIIFLMKFKFVSRLFFIIFLVISTVGLITEKMIILAVLHFVRKQGYNFKRLIIVGIGERAASFIRKIEKHPEWGFRIQGVLDYETQPDGSFIEGVPVLGTLDNLQSIAKQIPVDEVIFIVPRSALNKIEQAVAVCETLGIKATLTADFFELKLAKMRQTALEEIPLITFETTPSVEWQLFLKRAVDIMTSLLLLLGLSPFFIFVAIAIKATSRGSVLFKQKRVGLNGRIFVMYKFRTMVQGAHQRRAEFKDLNMMLGPVFKIKNDPRITKIGAVLRRMSIDELPQLFNVLIGHMSLVGPRPPLHKEVREYKAWQRRRLSMRPGLTCLWQISGRSQIGFEQWMELDLKYIDTWSLWLDFMILVKTIPVVLFGIGAY